MFATRRNRAYLLILGCGLMVAAGLFLLPGPQIAEAEEPTAPDQDMEGTLKVMLVLTLTPAPLQVGNQVSTGQNYTFLVVQEDE